MNQFAGVVRHKETIGPAWWRLTVTVPDLTSPPQPGQFLLLRCGDDWRNGYLRRPLFAAHLANDELTFLLTPQPDPGYAWLLSRQAGDTLDLLGPCGLGFPPLDAIGNLLLVGDGQTVGPLLAQLAVALAQGVSVTLALGGSRAAALYPVAALPPVVEYQAATLDGSLGRRGSVTDLTPVLLPWADAVFAVGSPGLYRTLHRQAGEYRLGLRPGYLYGLLADQLLACGVGACLSCTLATPTGLKLACLDGPVFDLTQLDL